MDDLQEQTEIANEIAHALSQPIGFEDVDEVSVVCCHDNYCCHGNRMSSYKN